MTKHECIQHGTPLTGDYCGPECERLTANYYGERPLVSAEEARLKLKIFSEDVSPGQRRSLDYAYTVVELTKKIDAARALHRPDGFGYCLTCIPLNNHGRYLAVAYPCPTAIALGGSE